MKRILCALLCVLMLSGCGKEPTPPVEDSADPAPEYFVVGEGVYRMEKGLDTKSVDRAMSKFHGMVEDYCGEAQRVFFALIPSKNGYLNTETTFTNDAEREILLYALEAWGQENFIDLSVCLTLEDYYRTDPHWRQEALGNVLMELGAALEFSTDIIDDDGALTENWTPEVLTTDYIGVYGDQVDGVPAETLTVLHHPDMEHMTVYNGETGEEIPLYDSAKLTERDPYELFAGGPLSLVTIENAAADNDRHLIVVRDSFASALLPLLAQSYSKVTAVDIRYMMPNLVGQLVDFTDADVLFLYSSTVINNSITLK